MNPKKEKTDLVHIGNILNTALNQFRPAMDTKMTRIWNIWDETVGDAIAMNAKPAAFKGDILTVKVSSSAWIQQLKFLEKDLVLKLNHRAGEVLIKKIRFKIGHIL